MSQRTFNAIVAITKDFGIGLKGNFPLFSKNLLNLFKEHYHGMFVKIWNILKKLRQVMT